MATYGEEACSTSHGIFKVTDSPIEKDTMDTSRYEYSSPSNFVIAMVTGLIYPGDTDQTPLPFSSIRILRHPRRCEAHLLLLSMYDVE